MSKFIEMVKNMPISTERNESSEQSAGEEFKNFQEIAKHVVKAHRDPGPSKKKEPEVRIENYKKIRKIMNSLQTVLSDEKINTPEMVEALFTLLDKTIDELYNKHFSVEKRLLDILEKFFPNKDDTQHKFDVLDKNGDILLGVSCPRQMLENFGMKIIREIDQNGFILNENYGVTKRFMGSDHHNHTVGVEPPFSKASGTPGFVSSSFAEEDKRRNDEFLERLKKEQEEAELAKRRKRTARKTKRAKVSK